MKHLLFFCIFFVVTTFQGYTQSDNDTISHFLEKYTAYKNLQIDRQDLLAVAALYYQIDDKDTAWADIVIKVRDKRIIDLSITGLNKTNLPEPLCRLDALEGLAIKGCYFYQLPSLKPFPALKYLGIWTSRLQDTLVVDISYKNLEILGLHQFHAKSIKFAENLKIKTLYIIDGNITKLDKSFENLKNVEEIHLGGNKLETFDLTMLPKLKKVNCYRNIIPTIHRKSLKHKHVNIVINFDEY
jgi:Leucine-rich repeat (LRR) protein